MKQIHLQSKEEENPEERQRIFTMYEYTLGLKMIMRRDDPRESSVSVKA